MRKWRMKRKRESDHDLRRHLEAAAVVLLRHHPPHLDLPARLLPLLQVHPLAVPVVLVLHLVLAQGKLAKFIECFVCVERVC